MESLLVSLILGLLQQLLIVLTLDLVLFAQSDGSEITISRSVNEWNRLKVDHFFSDSVLVSEGLLVAQVGSGHPIIRSITWDACDHTCSLLH